MSLAGLMSGAECAVEVNPLSQVLKHTDGDRSLQQVGLSNFSNDAMLTLPPLFRTRLLAHLHQE